MTSLDDLLPASTASEAETVSLGQQIATRLRAGDIIALRGPLGSGKTQLVRGILAGLGGDIRDATSPTYTLVHEYRAGNLPLYHFDAYRLKSVEELLDLGYDEYFFGDGISVVEWADRIDPFIPDHAVWIEITPGSTTRRTFARAPRID